MPIPMEIPPHRAGTGPKLVLLHGLGAAASMWDGLADLADRFELIAYDFPRLGDAFEIEDLADHLATLLSDAGIDRVHLMGCSLGGMVAQSFAAAHPGRVDRLVLCDTTPGLSEGMRDNVLAMPDAGPMHAAMARADLMDLAEEIYAPTLILCAEGADLAMREGADFLARSIPHGQFAFVPRARVNAVTERPDWVMRVLRDFLR